MFDPNKSFFDITALGVDENSTPSSSDYTDDSIIKQEENQDDVQDESFVGKHRDEILSFSRGVQSLANPRPWHTQIDTEAYDKYGVKVHENNDNINELDKQRARAQSNLEKAYNALLQGVVDIGAIGAAQGFSDLYDVFNGNIFRSDNNFQNPVSKYLEELGENFRNNHPIYVEDPDKTILNGGLADFGWYAKNFPSIFSFLSFMIPSSITTNVAFKGVNAISKLSKSGKGFKGTEELIKASRTAKNVQKAVEADRLGQVNDALKLSARISPGRAEDIKQGVKLGVNSVLGTYMANYTFARDIYNENYITAKSQLAQLQQSDPEGFIEFMKRNKELTGYDEENPDNSEIKSIDEISKGIAHNAAMTDFYWNILTAYPMLSQMYGTVGMWRGMKSAAPTAALNILNRNAAKGIGKTAEEITQTLAGRTFKERLKDTAKNTSFQLGSLSRMSFDAALGNAINVIAQKEGERRAQTDIMSSDKDFHFDLGQTLSYFADGNLWDAAVWGALGGVFSNYATRGAMNIAGRALGKEFLIDEKIRENEINNRTNLFKVYSSLADKVTKDNKNILDPIKDKNGEFVRDEKGDIQFNPIESESDRNLAINTLFDHYLQNVAIDAANVGNLDLLKEYLKDPHVVKAMVDAGFVNESDADMVGRRATQIIDEMEASYNRHIAANDRLGIDPYANRIIATENVRYEFDIRDADREISAIRNLYEAEKERVGKSSEQIAQLDADLNRLRAFDYINRLRDYRAKLNYLKDKKGIDVEIQREQLTKAINSIEEYIKTLGFDRNTNILIGYRSRLIPEYDSEGRVVIIGKDNNNENVVKTLTEDADNYLAEAIKDMSESEAEGVKTNINKYTKDYVSASIKLYANNEELRLLAKELSFRELDRQILKDQLNTTDDEIRNRAAQIERAVNDEANARVIAATAIVTSLMKSKDTNVIYDYINHTVDKSELYNSNLTDEEIESLDDAILVLGVNDKRYRSIIKEISQIKDSVIKQKAADDAELAKGESGRFKPNPIEPAPVVNYDVEEDKDAEKFDAKKAKVGDVIVYKDADNPALNVRARIDEIIKTPAESKPAIPNQKVTRRKYNKTIKVLDKDKVYSLAKAEKRIYTKDEIEEEVRKARKKKPSLTKDEENTIRKSLNGSPNYTTEELKDERFMKEIPDTSEVKYIPITNEKGETIGMKMDDETNVANGIYTVSVEDLPGRPATTVPEHTTYVVTDVDTNEKYEIDSSQVTHKLPKFVSEKPSTERKSSKGTTDKGKGKSATESKKSKVSKDITKANVGDEITFTQDEKKIKGKVTAVGTDGYRVSTPDGEKRVPFELVEEVIGDSSKGVAKSEPVSVKGAKKDYTGNKETGGLLSVGDEVNVVSDGEIIRDGVITNIEDDDIYVKFENGQERKVDIDFIARKQGKVELGSGEETLIKEGSMSLEQVNDASKAVDDAINLVIHSSQFRDKLESLTPYTQEEVEQIRNGSYGGFESFAENNGIDSKNEDNRQIWNSLVDKQLSVLIEQMNNIINSTITTKLSTVKELATLDRIGLGESNVFAEIANKLVKEYIDTRGIEKYGRRTIVDAVDLLRYMYDQGATVLEITNMFGSLRRYMEESKAITDDIYIQTDNLINKDSRELYDAIVTDRNKYNNSIVAPYQTLRLNDIYSEIEALGNTQEANNLKTILSNIKIGDKLGLKYNSSNDGIEFTINNTTIAKLPIPVIQTTGKNAGRYAMVNDGWITDIYSVNNRNRSDFIDLVQTWFDNTNGNHQKLWNFIYFWSYELTKEDRAKGTGLMFYIDSQGEYKKVDASTPATAQMYNVVDYFNNLDEIQDANAKGFIPKKSQSFGEPSAVIARLNHLRKLFVYNNSSVSFKLKDWVDKLKASYDLINTVARNPNAYEVTVKGINEGKLHWSTNKEDRGPVSERIAGYNNNPDDFKVGVSSVNGVIDVAGEPIPESFDYSSKGRTYLIMPFKGAGIRHFVHAYPTNVNSDILGDEAVEIVNEVKDELYNRLMQYLESNDTDNFNYIKDFLMSVFYNRKNLGPNGTSYSLFRLNYNSRNADANAQLTATDNGNTINLGAGSCFISVTLNRTSTFDDSTFRSDRLVINGVPLTKEQGAELRTEINKLFNNIAFDVNINFIKNDIARNKTFGTSIVSKGKNGEFIVSVPNGRQHVFKNYNRFLMDQNLITVTTSILNNGTNFEKNSDILTEVPQLKVSIESKQNARRGNGIDATLTTDEIITDIQNPKKSVSGLDIVKKLIPDLEEFSGRLKLFPGKVVFDNSKLPKGSNAIITFDSNNLRKQPIVYVGDTFIDLLKPASTPEQTALNRQRAVRLLMHEQMHYLLAHPSNADNVQKIKSVYEDFRNAINDSNNKDLFDSVSKKYGFVNGVESARDFLFEDSNHTTENDRLEEFLIESLTNARLADYLNNIMVNDNAELKKENLWQRVMRYVLELMGIEINKGSLYEKEFNALNSSMSKEITTFAENINNTSTENISNEENANNQEEVNVSREDGDSFETIETDDFEEEETRFSNVKEYNTESKAHNIDDLINSISPKTREFVRNSINDGRINFICRY